MSLFPDLIQRPKDIFFADQEENEVIELFLRRHFITNLPWVLITIILIILPWFLSPVIDTFGFGWLNNLPDDIELGLWTIWGMMITAYVLENFLHWYFNIYIVTNLHLVDINFHNLLYRDKTEIRLEDIQSSRPSIKGFIPSLFNYGDIVIETAAEKQRIEFHGIPRPDLVAEVIQDLQRVQEGVNK